MRQLKLFNAPKLFHGGELQRRNRKSIRPLATDRSIHLVLKTRRNIWCRRIEIIEELARLTERFDIRLYDVAPEHCHIHILIKTPSRAACVKFIRSFTGILARKFGKGLWNLLPFTRIVPWGRAFRAVQKYFQKNRDEAVGRVAYEPRKDWYQSYRPK